MQINFFMDSEDIDRFHEYLFSRGGYITPEYWGTTDIPLFFDKSPDMRHRSLKLFKEDIFSKSRFTEPGWIVLARPRREYYVHGPGMEYIRSYLDSDGIHHGRLYMGLVSHGSFIKPNELEPNVHIKYGRDYKNLENFYRSCCNYIRKNYRKHGGFYHGSGSDRSEVNGVTKCSM